MFSGRIQAMFLSQSKNAAEEALREWIERISLTLREFSWSQTWYLSGCWRTKVAFSRAPGKAELQLVVHHPPFPWLGWRAELPHEPAHDRDRLCVPFVSLSGSSGPAWPEGDSRAPSCARRGWDRRAAQRGVRAGTAHPFPLLNAEPQPEWKMKAQCLSVCRAYTLIIISSSQQEVLF